MSKSSTFCKFTLLMHLNIAMKICSDRYMSKPVGTFCKFTLIMRLNIAILKSAVWNKYYKYQEYLGINNLTRTAAQTKKMKNQTWTTSHFCCCRTNKYKTRGRGQNTAFVFTAWGSPPCPSPVRKCQYCYRKLSCQIVLILDCFTPYSISDTWHLVW